MGLFSKKKKTNITQTGLGDAQFEDIIGNQTALSDQTSNLATNMTTGFASVNDNVTDLADANETRFDTVDASLSGISGDMDTGFADVISGQDDLATSVDTRLNQTDENISTGFTNIGNDLSTGIDTINNNVDTRVGELDTSISTGFENTNANMDTGFTNLTNTVNENDAVLLANQVEGFEGVGNQVSEAESNLSNQLTTTSENVLGGQDTISALIEKYGGDAAQYYADLSAGQTTIRENQGNLQTAFDGYLSDFGDYTTLANQTRSDLGQTVVGGYDTMGQILGNQAKANAEGFASVGQGVADGIANVTSAVDGVGESNTTNFGNIAASMAGLSQGVEDASEESQINFASVATEIATGFTDTSVEGEARKSAFLNTLDTVQQIIQSDTGNLDASIKDSYTKLLTSFDDQGSLITETALQNGNTITRALSNQGQLFLAEFDDTGSRIGEQSMNINEIMGEVNELQSSFGSTEDFLKAFQDMGGNLAEFSNRFDELSAQERAGQEEFKNRLTQVRALLQEDVSELDQGLRARMAALNNAFDDEGQLIESAIDTNGNMLRRTIDESGNLILGTYSRMNGQLLDRQALSIDRLMKEVVDRRITQGSNANMGGQSPTAGAVAPASVYSGFASPYAQTV